MITLIELPLVLPPAVAGIGLLAAFGAGGLFGDKLQERGIVLPFTEWAVVMAVVFVASPFYLRQAISAFESVDPTLTTPRERSAPRRAHVLPDRAAARRERPGRRLGARVRARDRRVRRHDRVRRQRAR